MRNSEFFISFVRHVRFIPKMYTFDYRFFWTKFDLDELDELSEKTFLFSRNRFNLVSFYDHDHIDLGHRSLKENVVAFLREQGIQEDIQKIELITNPRILGYTFNPVSFYFIKTSLKPLLIIEIGNTFKEQKPYFVPANSLRDDEWIFKTQKNFYISPFTSVENFMIFRVKLHRGNLSISIDDFDREGKLEVRASMTGHSRAWSDKNIIKLCLSYPLITFRIIAAIHYHALKLYLMKIPYWKKKDNAHLQTGVFEWKDKSFKRLDG